MVGYNYSSTVTNCFGAGSVYGYAYVGGLVGYNYCSSSISNCYSTSSVSGRDHAGGLVGYNYFSATVSNCYSKGSVSGAGYVGGLVAYNLTATVSNSFWDTQTSGTSVGIDEGTNTGATGKTTSEMKTIATFTDETTSGLTIAWDFETDPSDDAATNDYWDIDLGGTINSGYPFLSWENGTDISLPVELSSFSAKVLKDMTIQLEWVTESEVENLGFILERKSDQTEWLEIASYLTQSELEGQGSVSHMTEYHFIDKTVEVCKTYHYRLADVSYDGVLEYHFLQILGIEVTSKIPKIKIIPAFPNPFNPSTIIQYSLPEQTDVHIIIYDISGREIKTLIRKSQSTGRYEVQWNGKDNSGNHVGSGMYLARVQAGKHSKVMKITCL